MQVSYVYEYKVFTKKNKIIAGITKLKTKSYHSDKIFPCPKHRLVLVSYVYQHKACTKKKKIIVCTKKLKKQVFVKR